MNKNLNDIIFSNYLKNKKIIIVGPGDYLIGKKNGKFIDSFDIVIRIKRGFPINKSLIDDLGEKTNILLSSLKTTKVKDSNKKYFYQNNFSENDINDMNNLLNFILFPYPTIIPPFNKFYNQYLQLNNLNTILISGDNYFQNYNNFIKELETTPTIFLSSLVYLLKYKFRELYIIGITFQKEGYYPQYKTKEMVKSSQIRTLTNKKNKNKNSIHDMNKEIFYFKKLLNNDKRIIIDQKLKSIINIL